ncbi:hypothetical protein OUZ56_033534 [Daphnia magna]|uniref:Uncharacterized protein n=1 Tax=Daphnia magna TaxID=35525 RepID=A0ABQ9ZXY9_9CRUS|nr:hypothetical protein OUZ56_033534 [Daphnia magna]
MALNNCHSVDSLPISIYHLLGFDHDWILPNCAQEKIYRYARMIGCYVRWNALEHSVYRCFPSAFISHCSNFSHCLVLLDCGTQSPISPRLEPIALKL